MKTRLAAAIGADAALRVYRRLAEHCVAEARGVGDGVVVRVHFTPADRGAEVAGWLGPGAEYLPQAEGPLGTRLEEAFAAAFAAGFGRVVVIGSDLPRLDAAHLRAGLEALERSSAVLGPARDGGYWLLGLREPKPEVFRGVPWSTDGVLPETLARFRDAGAEPVLLEELTDVDEVGDLPPGWREWAEGAQRNRS